MSTVFVSYNPTDFFYENINRADVPGTNYHLKPTDEECKKLEGDIWYPNKVYDETSCNVWFSDNSLNCIKYQLCKNKDNIQTLNDQEDKHNSDFGKNTTLQTELTETLLNTFNLGIGIVFVFFVIYRVGGRGTQSPPLLPT